MEKYSRGNIINPYAIIFRKMKKEGIPVCSWKEKGLDCPDRIDQCPFTMHEWVKSCLALHRQSPDIKGISPVEETAAAFEENGCRLFAIIRESTSH